MTFAVEFLKWLGVIPKNMNAKGVSSSVAFRTPENIAKRRRGATYPEQSARQSMRGYRRKQGGPGLVEGAFPGPRGEA